LCLERLRAPLGRWHSLECAATLALATGRFSEAVRLSREAFTLISGMGHPVAFGGYAVILCQAGLHIGFDRSGATELFGHIPAHLKPDVVDTTRGVATVFPALSFAMIRVQQGDRAGAGVYMGPVELPLGRAAAALGRLDAAVEDLQTAIAICDANGARGCSVEP